MSKATNATPKWMVTFADLMALLVVFFVLLYSYSTIDQKKYEAIIESMGDSFSGVGLKVGRPSSQLTPNREVIGLPFGAPIKTESHNGAGTAGGEGRQLAQNERVRMQIEKSMQAEIEKGVISVHGDAEHITIQFPDVFTFDEGSDELTEDITPIIGHIAKQLEQSEGHILISGHTDSRPISNEHFNSNWSLSAARAVAVLHMMLASSNLDPRRLSASGHADTLPLVPNTSLTNMARNRRVEIHVSRQIDLRKLSHTLEEDIKRRTQEMMPR